MVEILLCVIAIILVLMLIIMIFTVCKYIEYLNLELKNTYTQYILNNYTRCTIENELGIELEYIEEYIKSNDDVVKA